VNGSHIPYPEPLFDSRPVGLYQEQGNRKHI
jgi:hypothetical protein